MSFLLSVQEKVLTKKHEKNLKRSFSNSTSKTVMENGCTLNITMKTEENKVKLEKNIEILLKKFDNSPEKILKFIEKNGTPVFRNKNAKKILNLIKEEEGLINELNGIKALILNLSLRSKFSMKTEKMFVMDVGVIDAYMMIHQFYKWYAMRMNMPGFDWGAQENFKKYINNSLTDIDNLDIEEILLLEEAIARDVDAINFVVNLANNTEKSKNAMKKMTDGGANV
jgi:hypothetical protein